MIADDAGFIRQIIRDAYIDAGHQIVAETATGPETILQALEVKPDLLILDLVLPGLNGLEVATEIAQQDSSIMIVAMSSLNTDWIADDIKKAGCLYFLRKPFTKDELLRVIDMVQMTKGNELKHG